MHKWEFFLMRPMPLHIFRQGKQPQPCSVVQRKLPKHNQGQKTASCPAAHSQPMLTSHHLPSFKSAFQSAATCVHICRFVTHLCKQLKVQHWHEFQPKPCYPVKQGWAGRWLWPTHISPAVGAGVNITHCSTAQGCAVTLLWGAAPGCNLCSLVRSASGSHRPHSSEPRELQECEL